MSALDSDSEFRALNVGASEVAALFDASPFVTRFELWHRKRGTIATPDFGGNERIEAGIRLEPVIIEWACDRWGYVPKDTPARLDNVRGFTGHPDALVMCPSRGAGILEVKTADWLVAKKWGDEPPLHYLLQAQAYAGLANVEWADVIVLVGGNEMRRYQYPFRPVLFADMEARVVEFWRSVREGVAPKPDYTRDGESIAALNADATDTIIDLRADNRAAECAWDWVSASADEKAAKARKEAAQAELVDKLGTNASAFLEGYVVSATPVKPTPERVAEPGEIIRGRKGYRRFAVKEQQERKAA